MAARTLLYDVGIAVRSLRRSPGFVMATVLSLGLAVGAGVAGFGVLDAVRFRALPFPHADRLVLISEVPRAGCPNVCDVNYKTFALLRAQRFKSIDALAGFAMIGLVLAITGLYGVLSYVVQQRTQEIGIRGVLGAGRGRILGMVLSQAMLLTLVGIAAGLLAAMFSMRLMQGLLYGTPTNDPTVYTMVALTTLGVALVASYVPARRAAGVDPVIALRAA